ncbi:MAG: DUF4126 domain-containing protein [Phycisphaerales bacterium]
MPDNIPHLIVALSMGIALAAATGCRVFVPLLVLSLAAQGQHPLIHLAPGFQWIASPAAMVIFASATVMEIAGYYIPWVDHLLDTLATPAATVAGIIAAAAALGDIDPALKWTLAVIAGGGVASAIQLLTVTTRAASTVTTAGVGNPVVSTAEAAGSIVLSILALVIPVLVALIVLLLIAWLIRKFLRHSRKLSPSITAPTIE